MLNSFLITQLTLAVFGAPGVGPQVTETHVRARLLADAAAIKPGGKVMLAAQFVVDREWHIYWRNNGPAAGLPTRIRFTVPKGWSMGPLLYPAPISHGSTPEDKTYILDGPAPMIMAELTAPPSAKPGQTVKIAAEASWLVCKQECVKGEVKLSLDVPVVSAGAKVEATNESEFKKARRALPVAMANAKHLKVRSVQSPAEIKPGQKFKIDVVLDVEKGYHIQSAQNTVEGLVRTELFLDAPNGVLTEEPTYPAGKERVVKDVGKVSEYAGSVKITVEGETEPDIALKPIKIYANLRYQACNEAGTCYPPITAEFVIPLKVAGAKAASAEDEDDGTAVAGAAPGTPATGPPAAGPPPQGNWLERAQNWFTNYGVIGYLAMALVGGFLLNFMPCVLPVISIKVLSFVRQAHEHRLRVFALGLAFSAGIIVSFAALGIVIRQFGGQWGGLFQNPRFVIGMAAVVTAFAMSLFGVFSLNPPRAINELGEKVQGEGLASAFGTGLLATALGTACTAPFISAVVALAIKQPPNIAFGIFVAAGFGMAVPYIALTAHPAWVKLVPRPGAWMGTFERIVGFLLLGTVVWLLKPLGTQLGSDGLLWTIVFLLFVAAAVWVLGRLAFQAELPARIRTYSMVALLLVGGWLFCFRFAAPISALQASQLALRKGGNMTAIADFKWTNPDDIPWLPYSHRAAEEARAAGKTYFVDYTADWCVNCKTNERLVIDTDNVRNVMRDLGVIPFKADYTSEDPEIKADLEKHGRAGVPMYVIVSGKDPENAAVLPEVLTPSLVIDELRKAGPSAGVAAPTAQASAAHP